MFGVDDHRRRRNINLAGNSSSTSSESILDQAKRRRLEREDNRRKQDSATAIQSWYRGHVETLRTRSWLREILSDDLRGIMGLRALVLIGLDREALAAWSEAMQDGVSINAGLHGPQRDSWIVLLRQASWLLLKSVANAPQQPEAAVHLQLLQSLISSADTGTPVASYLLPRGHFHLISVAFRKIPVEAKTSPVLPHLASLCIGSLSALSDSPHYPPALSDLFKHILSIPLLPNRIPIKVLPTFSATLPFANLSSLPSNLALDAETTLHLLANLMAFVPPRYAKLPGPALTAYLSLLAICLHAVPPNSLEAPKKKPKSSTDIPASQYDSDTDSSEPNVAVVSSFDVTPAPSIPVLDNRTYKRLDTLHTTSHVSSLLSATSRSLTSRVALIRFLLALEIKWPSHKSAILSSVLLHGYGTATAGMVREIYRGWVRGSVLGREESAGAIYDPANADAWPPLLFLADLYTQALLTMGDDEFFGTSPASAPRNPLTLDEVSSFSRQLLNIAFTLYWRADETLQSPLVSAGISWEEIRGRVTKCLVAIHARDSRRPFTKPDHWLVTNNLEATPVDFSIESFVEAALSEEQSLSSEQNTYPPGLRTQRSLTSKRQLMHIAPRLGVLHAIPFAIPFEVRVAIFRHFVANDVVRGGRVNRHNISYRRTRVVIRREHVAEDGFDKLGDADLKDPIEIVFIDKFGQEEAGIDGGGVFKEFFTSLCKQVFDTDRGLWLANKENELYPNPHRYATESHNLDWYRFIGRIIGKALYEGILVDVAFAGFFLAKWLGKQSYLDDLASLDPDLYKGLIFLKHYQGNPEDLSLNFSINVEEFGETRTVNLIPGGSDIPVTKENRLQYIHLVSHYRLTRQIKLQSEAFFDGLTEMIDPKWLKMFNQQELQILIGGVNSPVDLDDLRRNTNYGGLYDDNEKTITMFWDVVNTFDQDQRRALLRFATSCSRPPLLGFKELVPNFAIRDAGGDNNRLPTASTCVNLLKLPRYTNEAVLRAKLLQAINANAGFDLS